MCPRNDATTTNKWAVKNGSYYEDSTRFEIVTLTDKKFSYRDLGKNHWTYTYERKTKKEVDPE